MVKNSLIDITLEEFHFMNSMNPTIHPDADMIAGSRIKLFTEDEFGRSIDDAVARYGRFGSPTILASAGGSDEVLSLYANLAIDKQIKDLPELLVVDRKKGNLDNFIFRYLTAALNPKSRVNYTLDLLGIPRNIDGLPTRHEFRLEDMQSFLEGFEYDPDVHTQRLLAQAEQRFGLDSSLYKLYADAVTNITKYLGEENRFELFWRGLLNSVKFNPETHYLRNNELYIQLGRSIKLPTKARNFSRNHVHVALLDMATPEGVDATRKILRSYFNHKKAIPVEIAIVPNIGKDMEQTLKLLQDEAGSVIRTTRGSGGKQYELTTPYDIIPLDSTIAGLAEIIEREKKAAPITNFSPRTELPGMPRTVMFNHPMFGYVNTDYIALNHMRDIANGADVEQVIISGGIFGPNFYRENAKRRLTRPELKTLDAQLRAFTEWRQSFEGNVVYVLSAADRKICADMHALYIAERRAKETGQQRAALTLDEKREEYNSKYDDAKEIIDKYIYPYMLRAGHDITRMTEESGQSSIILELVDLFKKVHYHRDDLAIRRIDRIRLDVFQEDLINLKLLLDTPEFKVIGGDYFDNEGFIGALDNPNYSDTTQYVDGTKGLMAFARDCSLGLYPHQKRPVLADLRSPEYGIQIHGDQLLYWVPAGADDYLTDVLDLPRVLADDSHKRRTVRRKPTKPGTIIIAGDPKQKLEIEPIFGPVIRTMDAVQRSGQGLPEIKVALFADTHIGNLSERPDLLVRFADYAFMDQGCIGAFLVGDLIQGLNYRGSEIEHALLGSVRIDQMVQGMVELFRPYFSLDQIQFWDAVIGNHERNSDWSRKGLSFLGSMFSAIRQINYEREGHEIDAIFSNFVVTPESQILQAPFSWRSINGYGFAISHQFTQWGIGEGRNSRPGSHITSWMQRMPGLSKNYFAGIGGHYHYFDLDIRANHMGVALGPFTGESGFEFERQLGGAVPKATILYFRPDGLLGLEILSDKFLEAYQPQHPDITKNGLDYFINQAFQIEAPILTPDKILNPKTYTRQIHPVQPKSIGHGPI